MDEKDSSKNYKKIKIHNIEYLREIDLKSFLFTYIMNELDKIKNKNYWWK